jgi:hypothetical protein
MPTYSATLAANVRCYRSNVKVQAETPDDAITALREMVKMGEMPYLKPDLQPGEYEALDVTDASTGLTVACDVWLDSEQRPTNDCDVLDAAMCLWEAVLETNMWASIGDGGPLTAERRDFCARIAERCHLGWVIAHADGDGYDDAFDWEFCPWFLTVCTKNTSSELLLCDDWRDQCAMLGARRAAAREDDERARAARAAITAPDAESLPVAVWMMTTVIASTGTVWAFDCAQEHAAAVAICQKHALPCATTFVRGAKGIAAVLELSGGMHEADELAHCISERAAA